MCQTILITRIEGAVSAGLLAAVTKLSILPGWRKFPPTEQHSEQHSAKHWGLRSASYLLLNSD